MCVAVEYRSRLFAQYGAYYIYVRLCVKYTRWRYYCTHWHTLIQCGGRAKWSAWEERRAKKEKPSTISMFNWMWKKKPLYRIRYKKYIDCMKLRHHLFHHIRNTRQPQTHTSIDNRYICSYRFGCIQSKENRLERNEKQKINAEAKTIDKWEQYHRHMKSLIWTKKNCIRIIEL